MAAPLLHHPSGSGSLAGEALDDAVDIAARRGTVHVAGDLHALPRAAGRSLQTHPGLAGLAAFLPGAILSPAAGIVADRHNRKRVCIAADLAAGIMATAFALAMGSWGVSVAAVIALLAARAAATSFQAPAMQAMVPQVVPAESLVEAGGMAQAISSASYILGPVVGGALFAALPLALILVTDLVGAVAAAVTLGIVPVPDHRAEGERPKLHPVRELRDGLSVFWEDRVLTQVIVSLLVLMVFFMPLSSFYPLMTSDFFGLGAFSAFQIVSMISTPIGLAVASPVAEVLGVSAWFGISGVAIVLLGAVMLVLESRARR